MIIHTYKKLAAGFLTHSAYHLPSRGVALQVLALSFKHTSTNLRSCRIVHSRINYIFNLANWDLRVDEVVIMLHKGSPLKILRYAKRTRTKLFHSVFSSITFALEYGG